VCLCVCHQHKDGGLMGREEIRVLRGEVYIMKSKGPRTEPWGTPHKQE